MDFVPILTAILFSPLEGFGFVYKNGGNHDLYFYSQFKAAEELQLKCKSAYGSYIPFSTAYVLPKNVNHPYGKQPIRRALFEDIYSDIPLECIQNKVDWVLHYPATEWNPCHESWDFSGTRTFTYSVFHNDQKIGMTSVDQEKRILENLVVHDNLLVAANSAGRTLTKARVDERHMLGLDRVDKYYTGG